MIERECVICSTHYLVPQAVAKRAYLTCSQECREERRRASWTMAVCNECSREFRDKTRREGARYCSNPCRLAALNRIPRPTKGRGEGFIDKRGHRILVVWDGDERRELGEHRLVMEQVVGRRLTPQEVVHHINEVPADNRADNLWLCADQAEHMRIHAFTDRLKQNGWLRTEATEPVA